MKKQFLNILISLFIGILSYYAFFSFYGVIATSSFQNELMSWSCSLAPEIRQLGIILESAIITAISSLPTIGLLSFSLGFIVLNKSYFYSSISFVSFFVFYLLYDIIFYKHCDLQNLFSPLSSALTDIFIWGIFFVLFSFFGYKLKQLLTSKKTQQTH